MFELIEQGVDQVAGISVGVFKVGIRLKVTCAHALGEFLITDFESHNQWIDSLGMWVRDRAALEFADATDLARRLVSVFRQLQLRQTKDRSFLLNQRAQCGAKALFLHMRMCSASLPQFIRISGTTYHATL